LPGSASGRDARKTGEWTINCTRILSTTSLTAKRGNGREFPARSVYKALDNRLGGDFKARALPWVCGPGSVRSAEAPGRDITRPESTLAQASGLRLGRRSSASADDGRGGYFPLGLRGRPAPERRSGWRFTSGSRRRTARRPIRRGSRGCSELAPGRHDPAGRTDPASSRRFATTTQTNRPSCRRGHGRMSV
jgi:hypothetical protein